MTLDRSSTVRLLRWAALIAILLVATFLRTWRLADYPPGFTHDEAAHGHDAVAILNGARPLYETVGYGREPLYDYVAALAMGWLGRQDYYLLRLVTAAFGVIAVAAAYACLRRLARPGPALLAAGMLAVSFWAVSTSRQALRSGLLPAFLALAVYFWHKAGSLPGRKQTALFALAGLMVAATLWTYMAARVTWTLFLLAPLLAALTQRARFKRIWPGMLLALGVGLALAAPMFWWLAAHPGSEQRLGQLDEPLRLLAAGNASGVIKNTLQALGMYTFQGDTLWLYNIPGRPWLGPVEGVLFGVGLLLAIWNWRRPANVFALAWLLVGTFPTMITGLEASGTRAVAVQPVMYLFPALAVEAAGCALERTGRTLASAPWISFASGSARRAGALAGAILIVGMGIVTLHDYAAWGEAHDVRVAYHTTLAQVAQYLDAQQDSGPVAISSIYPGRFHDPYSMDMLLRRRDLDLVWFDGRSALAVPQAGSRLIVQAISPIDPALSRWLAARPAGSIQMRPDDLNPRFDIYAWQGNGIDKISSRKLPPVDFGRTLDLIDYDIQRGSEWTVITHWRVRAGVSPDREAVIFAHLLAGPEGPALAGQDVIGFPSWQWRPGQEFLQVHHFSAPPGALLDAPIEVGVYTRDIPSAVRPNPPGTRFQVYKGDRSSGDRFILAY